MIKKRNIKTYYPFFALLLSAALFLLSSCSPNAIEISPMPAIDMSKNSIAITATDELSSPEVFRNQGNIELFAEVEELINQGSNTENNGMAAISGDTIYYINNGLHSMSTSGYHNKQYNEQKDLLYLSLSGEYIYYVSSEDYGVYRLNVNDMQSPERLGIEGAYSMMIMSDHIYYQNAIGQNADNYVYRADLDGTNPENLMIKSSAFCSDGRTIYFANAQDENKLYTLDTCTGELEQISNNQAGQINIVDSKIYYINKTTKHITKLDPETLESTVLSEDNVSYLNSNENLLVFYNYDTNQIGTMNFDGTDINYILDYSDVNALNVTKSWIFFESYENTLHEEVFYISTDGSGLSHELPVTATALIKEYDAETKTLYCDFVSCYAGEEALDEYINDFAVSERKAQEVLAETDGIYIQNSNPKILEYSLSDLTKITLNIKPDSSYSADAYSANISSFEEMYANTPELLLGQIYNITAYEGLLVKIEQCYNP